MKSWTVFSASHMTSNTHDPQAIPPCTRDLAGSAHHIWIGYHVVCYALVISVLALKLTWLLSTGTPPKVRYFWQQVLQHEEVKYLGKTQKLIMMLLVMFQLQRPHGSSLQWSSVCKDGNSGMYFDHFNSNQVCFKKQWWQCWHHPSSAPVKWLRNTWVVQEMAISNQQSGILSDPGILPKQLIPSCTEQENCNESKNWQSDSTLLTF